MRLLHGAWAAFEIYSPEVNPPRRIAALAATPAACAAQLVSLGLDPLAYEFQLIRSPL